MHKFLIVCLCLGGWNTVLAQLCPQSPVDQMFYQPLNVDLQYPETIWIERFRLLKSIGIDSLILQWTAYGETDFRHATTVDGEPFLEVIGHAASLSNMALQVGLYADPEWFDKTASSEPEELARYLDTIRQRSISQAQLLIEEFPLLEISGWYLSEEINDQNWNDESNRQLLQHHFRQTITELQSISPDAEVAVSGYSAGVLSDTELAEFWSELLSDSDLQLWFQDGRGTEALSLSDRLRNLDTLSNTLDTDQWGVIAEFFRQDSNETEVFSARPAPINSLITQIRRREALGDEIRITGFSLRYLFENEASLLLNYREIYCGPE